MQRWTRSLALVLLAVSGCTEQRAHLEEQPRDSAARAHRAARRRQFLEQQAAELALRAERDRRLREPVTNGRATVILFYPWSAPPEDSHPLHPLVKGAADTARAAGWEFAERFGPTLQIIDSGAHAIYKSPVARDSVGVAFVVPGYPPRVRYGLAALLELGARLRSLEAWLRARKGPAEADT